MAKYFSRKRVVWLVLIVALAVGGYMLVPWAWQAKAADYQTVELEQGTIRNVVNATGIVQTVVTVQVGSQVSGQVLELYADFNSVVKRGQLLAKLDTRTFDAQVENSRASVTAAQARVRNAEAEIKTNASNVLSAQASLEVARVARENAATLYKRAIELDQKGLISRNDLDTTKANADSANARYSSAAADLNRVQEAQGASAAAGVDQAKAQLEQAEADLERSRLNIEYTKIYSPVDGVVISRNVDVGQTIAASLQSPTLFTIANDLSRMQVNANVDEADIGSISTADSVKFTVADAGETFNAKIAEIRLSAQTVQNVVTYSVILSIDNRAMKLRPGMTANITFVVDERTDVLKIPAAALRYAPEGQQSGGGRGKGRGGGGGRGGRDSGASDSGDAAAPARGEARGEAPGDARGDAANAGRGGSAGAPAGDARGGGRGGGRGGRGEGRGRGGAEPSTVAAPAGGPVQPGQPVVRRDSTGGQLAPGQLWDTSDKMRFNAPKKRIERPGTVWVLNAQQKPEMHQLTLGITDGSFSEMVAGDLKAGDAVIVQDGAATPRTNTQGKSGLGQLLGGGGGGGGGGRRGGGF